MPLPQLLGRRTALKWIAGSGLVAAAGDVGKNILGNLLTPEKDKLLGLVGLSPNKQAIPGDIHERADILYRLFFKSGTTTTDFIAPDNWSGGAADVDFGPILTYGHEAEALRSISDYLNTNRLTAWQSKDFLLDSDEESSLVLLGSGTTNVITKYFLGTPDEPNLDLPSVKLHYSIAKGERPLKRLQYHKIIERDAHAISDNTSRTLLHPEAVKGRQVDDYLLVTRIPGAKPGTMVTIFSGLHGPASRAVELLWSLPITELRTLESRTGGEPFFQAVFRASEFEPQGEKRSSDPVRRGLLSDVPTRLELVLGECPPRPIRPSA